MSSRRQTLIPDVAHCPCAGVTLDKLIKPAILTVLAQGGLHGYRIAERLSEMAMFKGQKPDASGVYRSLRAMETRGLVGSSWDVSARGPAKRLYQISKAGQECLCLWIETLQDYKQSIAALLTAARKASASVERTPRSRAKCRATRR